MPKLQKQRAYYSDGSIKEYKTNRKTSIKTDGLVGLISFYVDGSRVLENVPMQEMKRTMGISKENAIVSQLQADLQPKSDSGLTPETIAYKRERRTNG